MLQIMCKRLEFTDHKHISIMYIFCNLFVYKCDDFSRDLDCKTAKRLDHTPMVLIFAK